MGAVCCKTCRTIKSVNNEISNHQTHITVPIVKIASPSLNSTPINNIAAASHVSTLQNAVEQSNQPLTFMNESVNKDEKENFLEKVVCHQSDLDENEMNEIDFGNNQKILLIKQNGKFYATGSECAHNGAPLVMGSLGDKRIRCPWHGACFNIETGDIEDFPGLDSIPCYKVNVDESGQVKIRARKTHLEQQKVIKPMTKYDSKNSRKFVIIGGGVSGATCAEVLRQNGFTGKIIIICKEAYLPYDRTEISRNLDSKIENIQLRSQSFYDENNIEIILSSEVLSLDSSSKHLKLSNEKELNYDKVYIATGTRARKPKISGIHLKNIFTLRTLFDASEIESKLNNKSHLIILGSSFLALELASYCHNRVAKTTIISNASLPLVETFGEQVGNKMLELLKSKNIKVFLECEIKAFVGINQENHLSAIKLSNGEFLKADLCIIAVGSKFNTKFLANSGILVNKNGSIDTNVYMQTNNIDVYAGGDIANSPIYYNNNEREIICHYSVAQNHGRVAALNMLGISTKVKTLPYFYTLLFDNCITYVGYRKPSRVFIQNSTDDFKFSAFYFDNDDNVVGIISFQPNKLTSDYAEKLQQGSKITRKDLNQLFGIVVESTEPLIKEKTLSEDFIEESICDINDIAENEMKEFVIDNDKKILLVKQEGRIHAIGSECSHYGAPLVMGSLGEGRIRCPWHGACFNIETGDIEDFPGLDSIPCYQVIIEERDVRVKAKKSIIRGKQKIIKPMAHYDTKSGLIFVIIGGGASGATCAEMLRQNGFMGRIIMICKESYLPYDRIKVSKFLDSKIEDIQLRSQAFYDEHHIELMLNIEATDVDAKLKEITLSCGNKLKYDKLFVASGCRAKYLKIPGSHLHNIFTLRTLDDAKQIHSKLDTGSHVVIVGSSFIALETATYCVSRVAKVTIIGRSSKPLIETFGEIIGGRIMEYFKSKKVEFIMEAELKNFLGNHKELERIELIDGRTIWADVCIVAIGSRPNTEFLARSGLKINYDGSIDTNEFLETNVRDIYIGGDIANSPIFTYYNKRACIQHYALAQYHGKIAALNMIGTRTELRSVPYFFTLLFDYCFTFTGYGRDISEIFVDGDLDEFKFAAFYFDEEQNVVGMSSCQPDKGISDFAEKLAQGFCYHRDDIEWAIELEEEGIQDGIQI
ncbi:hypothetical protein PVAND_011588 [Polypedilum vanderplanki]|uniref:Rieske domain-containing protein n=1 Tax=Polypedilum vanderplanki TaxID=319348 RepID=A0A9J6CKV6_POLVA|nr:hypothetical protein PVAND_011588 [Polypedilum vanderplanki]